MAAAQHVCGRCGKDATFIPSGGRDLRNLLFAVASGIALVVLSVAAAAQPDGSDAQRWLANAGVGMLVLMLVTGYFGIRRQDVITCNTCGHRAYVMVDR